jgi:hypothetical protein
MEHRRPAGRDPDARDRLATLDAGAYPDPEIGPRPGEHLAIEHRQASVVVDQDRGCPLAEKRLRPDDDARLHGAHDVARLGGEVLGDVIPAARASVAEIPRDLPRGSVERPARRVGADRVRDVGRMDWHGLVPLRE